MQSNFLKSTTAMVLAFAVAAPSPILAQENPSEDQLKKKLEQAAETVEGAAKEVTDKAIPAETEAEQAEAADENAKKPKKEKAANAEGKAKGEGKKAKQQSAEAEPKAEAGADGSLKAEGETKTEAEVATGDGAKAEAKPEKAAEADKPKKKKDEVAETKPAAEENQQAADQPRDAEQQTEAEPERKVAEDELKKKLEENQPREASDDGVAPSDDRQAAEEERPAEEAPEVAEDELKKKLDENQQRQASEDGVAPSDDQRVAEEEPARKTEENQSAEAKAAPSEETLSGQAPEVQAKAGAEGGELIEEQVTEETARSSDEEFATKVDEQAPERTEARAEDDDDEGLTTAQKIAIGGLGALAIGALLNNGQRVVSNSGDRVVVDDNGTYRVLKNDDSLLRQPGADVKTYSFQDGSTRTVVTNPDGTTVETIRASDGRVLSRTRVLADGREVVLFDDTRSYQEVAVNELPQVRESQGVDIQRADEVALRDALRGELANDPGRSFSLAQIRNITQVRALAPEIEVNNVNFDTGSAVIRPEEAEALASLGAAMKDAIDENPGEVFLVEGHTDAVGGAGYNLALSDRRAESLALALTEYFGVPPESMIVQGYGESDLKVQTAEAERTNRRAAVRRITPLLGDS